MLIISKMTHSDIATIAHIEKECFKYPWNEAMLIEELNNPIAYFYVAKIDNLIVGYGGFFHIVDEGHIANIAVLSSERTKGIGRLILNNLTEQAKELDIVSMTLEVRKSNIIAIALYESDGFVSAGVRSGYYPDGEDAVIYWKKMSKN